MSEHRHDEEKKVRTEKENRDPLTGEPGSHPGGVAAGTAAGAATGAAIGAAVGGPVGAAAGSAVGAVAGAYAGRGAAEQINPTKERAYWREEYRNRPYFQPDREFDRFEPAYRYGWETASHPDYRDRGFDEIDEELGRNWKMFRGDSEVAWADARLAARDAYEKVRSERHLRHEPDDEVRDRR